MKRKKADLIRIIALLIVVCAIIYFYLNIFFPSLLPRYLCFGVPHRAINILFMGTDFSYAEENGKIIAQVAGRTDTMVLINIDPLHHRINLLSIPRDTLVQIPGYGYQKINAAFTHGKEELSMKIASQLTGLNIDKYIILNPNALVELVDLMGGIKIFVDKDMYYTDNSVGLYINLKQGYQKLSGKQAMGFIRYRLDPEGDISRVQRQQRFVQTLAARLAKPDMLLRTPFIYKIARHNFQTNLSLKEILRILNFLRVTRKSSELKYFMVPGSFGSMGGIGSIWSPNQVELQDLIKGNFLY